MLAMQLRILTVLLFGSIVKGKESYYSFPFETDTGPVIGKLLDTVLNKIPYFAFKGIPYAEPPIGDLRFRPPVPKTPWSTPLYAISDKDRCIQMQEGNVVGSEDCLYLNVYLPVPDIFTKKSNSTIGILKPVMVWIHGGDFTTGHSSSFYYGPDFLLEKDVVVVAMNYRLGPLGFLNVHHANAAGNMGLKDQNLALKWVQRNICNFNGDPARVTIFGQSAGGVSVDLHKLSDMSKGLFINTISMSASPLCKYWPFQSFVEARRQAIFLGFKLGLSEEINEKWLTSLKNIPAADIIKAANELQGLPFRPTLEKVDVAPNQPKFLTECSPKKYKEGNYNKGPHLMGFKSLEILEGVKTVNDLINFLVVASQSLEKNVLASLPVVPEIASIAMGKTLMLKKTIITEIIKILSDIFFFIGIDMKQKLLQLHNDHPIYYYRFTYMTPNSAHKSEGIRHLDGIAHEDDLVYLFYRPHLNIPLNDTGIAITRERLVQMWTNFAKFGNPTPPPSEIALSGVTWPNSGVDGIHLEIGEKLTVKSRPISVLINSYQKLGFGDSNIYNDCEPNLLADTINKFRNILASVKNIASIPKKISVQVVDVLKDPKKIIKNESRRLFNSIHRGKNTERRRVTRIKLTRQIDILDFWAIKFYIFYKHNWKHAGKYHTEEEKNTELHSNRIKIKSNLSENLGFAGEFSDAVFKARSGDRSFELRDFYFSARLSACDTRLCFKVHHLFSAFCFFRR